MSETHIPGTVLGLSRRETEVLLLLSQGHAIPQIARTLHRSISTVKTHRRAIVSKLGVRTRAALAQFVAQHQLGTAAAQPRLVDVKLPPESGGEFFSSDLRQMSRNISTLTRRWAQEQRRLQAETQRLFLALDELPIPMIITDPEGFVRFANHTAKAMLDIREAHGPCHLSCMVPEEDQDRIASIIRDVIAGRPTNVTLRTAQQPAGAIDLRVSAIRAVDGHGYDGVLWTTPSSVCKSGTEAVQHPPCAEPRAS